METLLWIGAGALTLAVGVWIGWLGRLIWGASKDGNAVGRGAAAERASRALVSPPVVATFTEHKPAPNLVLVGPPMVGKDSLRDYLIHYSGDDQVWAKVVGDFYQAAAQDAEVFAVFQAAARSRGQDVGEMVAAVSKHFLAMLIILTHTGLTQRLADSLQSSHARVRISKDVYDKAVTALVQVLTRYGAPQVAFPRLVEMVGELEPRIVTV